MKVVFALFIAFVSANIPQAAFEAVESELIDLFSLWKDHHGKTYATHEEHQMRFSIFKSNVDSVNTFNREKAPVVGWTKAVNKFADLTAEEFKAKFNGYKRNKASRQLNASNIYQATNVGLPTSVDWRTKGAVTPVKNQEDCGSCWSFSATGAMETLHFLKTGNLVALSEQNLVDCSTSQGNKGCDGGDMGYAFKYVIANGGIDTEESYPYEAQGPTTCRYDEGTVGSTLSAYKSIAQGSESALQSALAGIGSVSVAIDASEMQFYSSGIYAPSSCSSTDLDHGVLAVGYDNTNPSAAFYWVKNSWGPDWGLDGYVKMAMNKDNMCGIATDASIPTAL